MADRNFEDHVRDLKEHSDKALYPYLQVHIFGPFEGDCFAYLNEVKFRLQEAGFEDAKVCDDRGNEPPEDADDQERMEFWWEESREFLENADVAVFLFLDHIFERSELPNRARDLARDPREDPSEVNSSVVAELSYWLGEIEDSKDRALVLFEDGAYDRLGSLVAGMVGTRDVRWDTIADDKIEEALEITEPTCSNWAMDEMRETLQRRFLRSE